MRRRSVLAALAAPFVRVVAGSRAARAADGCCARCGRAEGCRSVCRLVCETKKISVTCWGCREEDFCIPGPSRPGCERGEPACDGCGDSPCPSLPLRRFVWNEWIPNPQATVFTRKKLMKRTVTKTVPSYRWVVESLCGPCEAACETVVPAPGSVVPPAPLPGPTAARSGAP